MAAPKGIRTQKYVTLSIDSIMYTATATNLPMQLLRKKQKIKQEFIMSEFKYEIVKKIGTLLLVPPSTVNGLLCPSLCYSQESIW